MSFQVAFYNYKEVGNYGLLRPAHICIRVSYTQKSKPRACFPCTCSYSTSWSYFCTCTESSFIFSVISFRTRLDLLKKYEEKVLTGRPAALTLHCPLHREEGHLSLSGANVDIFPSPAAHTLQIVLPLTGAPPSAAFSSSGDPHSPSLTTVGGRGGSGRERLH